jgi:hypothetical protein
LGKAETVIAKGGGAMTSESGMDLVCEGLEASATVAVMLKVPVVVGVPETMPVVAPRVSPAGRLPAVMDQIYGVVPPVACKPFE